MLKNSSLVVSIYLSFFVSTPVFADPDTQQMTPAFQTCLDQVDLGGMKNSQWLRCYMDEFHRQDTVLNVEYKRLVLRTPKGSYKALLRAQRSWVKFRDDWCAFEEALPMAPSPLVNKTACLLDTTIEQIHKIRKEYPDFSRSTP